MDSWIIVADDEPVGGPLAIARQGGGRVTAVVIGPRERAEAVAAAGPDQVVWHPTAEGVPVESYAGPVAEAARQAAPRILVASDTAGSRVILGAAAVRLGAGVVGSLRSIAVDGDRVVVTRLAVDGKVLETLDAAGPVAGIYDGEKLPAGAATPAEIVEVAGDDPGDTMRIVETIADAGGTSGLRTAARVVGVGLGIRSRADLALVDELAAALRAEIACTLPVCDDMRWYDSGRVLGRSHVQVAPDLYVAVGISGQPQHMHGVRDAKVVVAINNDPDALIFRTSDYAILGDLYAVVPALTEALR